MPIEPPPSLWQLPSVAASTPGRELLAVGADLEPGTMLSGYRSGIFPMGHRSLGELGWWSPDPRGIIRPLRFHVSRSLRRQAREFTVTVDQAFDKVVAACGDPRRPHGWITDEFRRSYARLHSL